MHQEEFSTLFLLPPEVVDDKIEDIIVVKGDDIWCMIYLLYMLYLYIVYVVQVYAPGNNNNFHI